jgi:thiamine biosynthesis lipoprotein
LATIDQLEVVFSAYRPDSEFNCLQSTREVPVAVSAELAYVLFQAEHYRAKSENRFLPISDSLRDDWADGSGVLPYLDPAPLWTVDLEKCTATRHTDRRASLNAIAKGYIVDQAAEAAMKVKGVESVVVNIGGEIRHLGAGGAEVAVQNPFDDAENAAPVSRVKLQSIGVATSGGYRRGFSHEGRGWSHIFDPRLGRPDDRPGSTTVIAPTTMEADAIATVVGLMDPETALEWVAGLNGVGIFVVTPDSRPTSNAVWKLYAILSEP